MRQNSRVNGLGFFAGITVRRQATDIMESGTDATQAEPIEIAPDQPLSPPPAPHYQLLPIRQVMGNAHYLSQPALPKVPGARAGRVARRPASRTASGAVFPRRLHRTGPDRRNRIPE